MNQRPDATSQGGLPPRGAGRGIPVFAFLAVACAKSHQPPHPLPAEIQLAAEVGSLANRAEKLLRQQEEQVWKNWVDGTPIQMEKTYEGVQELFSPRSIYQIEQLRSLVSQRYQCMRRRRPFQLQCPGNAIATHQLLALDHLHMYFVGEYLSQSLSAEFGAMANLEASLTFSFNGGDRPYRDLDRLLSNERSAEGRRKLYAAATPAVARLSDSVRRKDDRLEELLRDLGYESHEAFGTQLRRTDLRQLGSLAEEVLRTTEDAYRGALAALGQRELDLPLEKLRRADFPRLFKGRGSDPAFPKEVLFSKVEGTLSGMGLRPGEVKALSLDVRATAAKNPSPLSLGIVVPADVRVSFKPVGGPRDLAALFHEMGHALHFAFTQDSLGRGESKEPSLLPDVHFELAKLGNRTVDEAYAILFERLTENPTWLEGAGVAKEKLTSYVLEGTGYRLYQIRRRAGRLLYELALHQSPPGDVKELYQRTMGRAYGVPLSSEDAARYLLDRDDLYQSADELRASFLAAQMQAFLFERFGPNWWRAPGAGDFLKELWSHGNAWSPEEVAARMEDKVVGPKILLWQLGAKTQPKPPSENRPILPSDVADGGGLKPSMPDAGT